jgi:hypothetical protein
MTDAGRGAADNWARVVLRRGHVGASGENDGGDDSDGGEKSVAGHGRAPDKEKGLAGELNRPNLPLLENAEMSFSYQKMSVSYQKQYFSYHLPSRCRDFPTSFLGS